LRKYDTYGYTCQADFFKIFPNLIIIFMARKKVKNKLFEQIQIFCEPNTEDWDFPAICKFIRQTFQITQLDIAEKLNIGVRTYQHWEAGTQEPSSKLALSLYMLFLEAKKVSKQKNSQHNLQETTNESLMKAS